MSAKPYSEIQADPSFLEQVREVAGLPDSVVEDATGGAEGLPAPGSDEVRLFFDAALGRLRQRPEGEQEHAADSEGAPSDAPKGE